MNFKKTNEYAHTPTRGSEYAAGADLYAAIKEPVWIQPHCTVKVDSGIAVEIPEGYFGAVFARSGIATNRGLRPANAVGVIDADYRGSIIVALHNDTDETRSISPGERIAQLVILPYAVVDYNEVETLSDTVRGAGGFGDSGRF